MTSLGLGMWLVLILFITAFALIIINENEKAWLEFLINEFALTEREWSLFKCQIVAHKMSYRYPCPSDPDEAIHILTKYDWS